MVPDNIPKQTHIYIHFHELKIVSSRLNLKLKKIQKLGQWHAFICKNLWLSLLLTVNNQYSRWMFTYKITSYPVKSMLMVITWIIGCLHLIQLYITQKNTICQWTNWWVKQDFEQLCHVFWSHNNWEPVLENFNLKIETVLTNSSFYIGVVHDITLARTLIYTKTH